MVSIHYFGHSFFKVSFSNKNVLIDPFVLDEQKDPGFARLVDCKVKKSDLKDIALILVSHEHFDHFDKQLIEDIALRDNCCVVAAEPILQELSLEKRFKHPIKMHETVSLRGLEVKAVPAHHPQAFYPLGFVISCGGKSVFHSGDSAVFEHYTQSVRRFLAIPEGKTATDQGNVIAATTVAAAGPGLPRDRDASPNGRAPTPPRTPSQGTPVPRASTTVFRQ